MSVGPADGSLAAEVLRRRGPDETYVVSDDAASVVVRRLSLFAANRDLASSQPSDGSLTVAFNGEIWNVESLARAAGLSHPSSCTEVEALAAYFRRFGGDSLVRAIDGMYAIVIVDRVSGAVWAGRDHCGIKPLFFAVDRGRLLLSSEVEGLVALGLTPRWNPAHAANHLAVGYSDAADCFLEGVRQLPPGRTLEARLGRPAVVSIRKPPLGETAAGGALYEVLGKAVGDTVHHQDHETVGLLLSGGIDSTLIAWLAATQGLGDRLVAITLQDPLASAREAEVAASVARELNLRHLVVPLTSELFFEAIDGAGSMSGSPFVANSIMFSAIKAALPELRVVICGEGADELFAGYQWHLDPRVHLQRIAARARRTPIRTSLLDRLALLDSRVDPLGSVLALDQSDALVDRHLLPLDHGSMWSSIELRVPFLHRASWLWARRHQPVSENGQGKLVLREILAATGLLSAKEVAGRPKVGLPNAFGAFRAASQRWAAEQPFHPALREVHVRDPILSPFTAAWYSRVLYRLEDIHGRFTELPQATASRLGTR